MNLINQVKFILQISRSHNIVRRYFVVNGFDGALTMLGLVVGFVFSNTNDLSIVLTACLSAAIALGMSGMSSAYVSESAERKRALTDLEMAMIRDMRDSAHGDAARYAPFIISIVNGFAPFIISLLILSPIILSIYGFNFVFSPLYLSILIALILVFLLGVFLGRVSGISWFQSGLQTLLVALITALLIFSLA